MDLSITIGDRVFTYDQIVNILHGYIKHAEACKRYRKSTKGLIATRRSSRKYERKKRERLKQEQLKKHEEERLQQLTP